MTYTTPDKSTRECRFWWFDAWDKLVNAMLALSGSPAIPKEPGTFCLDTHVHTLYSHCSISQPEKILKRAAAIGLSGVAIMDHNTPAGARDAMACADWLKANNQLPQDFLVIPGQEVNTTEGHVGVLFDLENYSMDLTPAELVRQVHENGSLAVAVHPFHSTGIGEAMAGVPFDLVEIDCGAAFDPGMASRARDFAEQELAGNPGKLGSSDSHYVNGLGFCYTVVTGSDISLEGVRKAMLEGRTRSCSTAPYARMARMLRGISKLK